MEDEWWKPGLAMCISASGQQLKRGQLKRGCQCQVPLHVTRRQRFSSQFGATLLTAIRSSSASWFRHALAILAASAAM